MTDISRLNEDRLVEHLQELGLTEYQSRAYIGTVNLVNARPSEIVEESGVPQARIYDVIDDLSDMGLVEIHEQSGGKTVSAPSPEAALEHYKERHVGQFSSTVELVSRELEKTHEQERITEGSVTVLSHEKSANRHMRRAIEEAEWWLALSLSPDRYALFESEIRAALDRGVTVRLVVATTDSEENVGTNGFPDGLRVRTRQISDVLVAADRAYSVYSGGVPTNSGRSYHVVANQSLTLQFQHYYEQIWSSSRIVQETISLPARYLNPWRAIIDLQSEFDNGHPLEVRVVGHETDSRIGETWMGRLVDYELKGPIQADYTVSIPVQASLVIDTGEETLSIGGWKASVEDIAADGLEISRVD